MPDRDIGQEILEGIREIKAFKEGKVSLRTFELKDPSPSKTLFPLVTGNPQLATRNKPSKALFPSQRAL